MPGILSEKTEIRPLHKNRACSRMAAGASTTPGRRRADQMAGLFYNMGRMTGTTLRKGKWIFQSLAGTEAEAIAAERAMGRDLAAAIMEQTEPDPDGRADRLVSGLGARLAGRLTNRQRRFRFQVLSSSEVNAFALPGGFVFVTRSLLELCGWNADELAFVLGHEMGHIVRGHAIERIVGRTALQAAARALPAGRLVGRQLLELGTRYMTTAYSRTHELEADRFGLRLLVSAGSDPRGSVRLLQRLAQKTVDRDESPLAAYLATHPPAPERIAQIKQLLRP